tara:strand:- start:1004 stop:1522 length:519 start_codon:yes stop_codon:yes gene_type:complete
MGAPMALILVKGGNKVYGFDTDGSIKLPELIMTSWIPSLLKEIDVVFTMLPSGLIVKEIIHQFIGDLSAKSTLLDCSTIDVKTTKDLCKILHKRDIYMLDAPVSGSVQGAKSGSLTFMVGGSTRIFEKFQFLFYYICNRAVYCGETGSGQSAKICNNMILLATMIALLIPLL